MKALLHLLIVCMLIQPTRFGNTSSTLIDNIFSNKCNNSASSGLLITDISDHLPVFYISKSEVKTNSLKFVTTSSRVTSQSNIAALRVDLLSTDWSYIEQCSNIN